MTRKSKEDLWSFFLTEEFFRKQSPGISHSLRIQATSGYTRAAEEFIVEFEFGDEDENNKRD